jgi:cytochrome b6-f complex iron-sulfur subunit
VNRREFFERGGWAGVTFVLLAMIPGTARFLRPPTGAARGTTAFDAGPIDEFRRELVSSRWLARHHLWIVCDGGVLYALVARCTHLGCTPRWAPDRKLFLCPCHGSRFSLDGVAVNGPARDPLRRSALRLADGRLWVDPATTASLDEAETDERFTVRL